MKSIESGVEEKVFKTMPKVDKITVFVNVWIRDNLEVSFKRISGPWRLATAWTVRGSNPDGGEIFPFCPVRPWGPTSLPYNGYRVFPGCKERPGHDADPSPPSRAVVMKG